MSRWATLHPVENKVTGEKAWLLRSIADCGDWTPDIDPPAKVVRMSDCQQYGDDSHSWIGRIVHLRADGTLSL